MGFNVPESETNLKQSYKNSGFKGSSTMLFNEFPTFLSSKCVCVCVSMFGRSS